MKHKLETKKGEIIILQLRTGYVKLNEYQHKTNIAESDLCQCGEIESVKHYLMECELYENGRELLRQRLFESCGIAHLDMNLLLDAKHDDEFMEWRDVILSELETVVLDTKRFLTPNSN